MKNMHSRNISSNDRDHAMTSLASGCPIEKSSPRIKLVSLIEELNSSIGVVVSQNLDDDINIVLIRIQDNLLRFEKELLAPATRQFEAGFQSYLNEMLSAFSVVLPTSMDSVLPGGAFSAAMCHMARAICRTAECELVSLDEIDPDQHAHWIQYMNVLSDLLFTLACTINARNDVGERFISQPTTE